MAVTKIIMVNIVFSHNVQILWGGGGGFFLGEAEIPGFPPTMKPCLYSLDFIAVY